MKILNIKKTFILSLSLMIGSANAGILNSISKKFSNAGNAVEQKFELKKKYENTKAFVKKHKKAAIGTTILTAVISAGLIYQFIIKGNPAGRLPRHRISNSIRRGLDQIPDVDENTPMCAVCRDPLANNPLVSALTCMHTFHTECVAPWLQAHNNCPTCRIAQ